MGLFGFLKVSLGGLLLLAMAACSSDGPADLPAADPAAGAAAVERAAASDPAAAKNPRPRPPQAEPAPAAVPAAAADSRDKRRGGSLIVAVMAETPHRDLHREYQETLAAPGTGLAYSRLLRIRSGPETADGGLTLECDLCESWELTPDWNYEFTLRPNVHWHNRAPVNGRKLTAADLAYSYARLRTPGWPGAARFADRGIGEIAALDDHTLRVNLNFRDSDGLLALADGHSKIIAPEVAAEYGDLQQAPVIGTGPWIWEDDADGGGHFRRNPDYFVPELPYLDELTIKAVKHPEGNEGVNRRRLALYRARLVDVIVAPPTDWQALWGSNAEFNARVSLQPEIGIALTLNTQAAPLDNLDLRRAVFKAVDPWEYVDLTWAGQGGVGLGLPLPDPDWQLTRSEMHADYLASPSEARDILVANGIHNPLPLELAVADLGPDYRALGEQVAADLRAVGFAPNVRLTPANRMGELLFGPERDYQLALGPLPPHPTANGYLYALLHSRGPGNIAGHSDAALDGLIERQAAELDPARRGELLRETQRRVMEQGYMFSPVTGSYRWVFDWDLQNFYPNTALGEYHYWAEAWLKR